MNILTDGYEDRCDVTNPSLLTVKILFAIHSKPHRHAGSNDFCYLWVVMTFIKRGVTIMVNKSVM